MTAQRKELIPTSYTREGGENRFPSYARWARQYGEFMFGNPDYKPAIHERQFYYRLSSFKKAGFMPWETFFLINSRPTQAKGGYQANKPIQELKKTRTADFEKAKARGITPAAWERRVLNIYRRSPKRFFQFDRSIPKPMALLEKERDIKNLADTPHPKKSQTAKDYVAAKRRTTGTPPTPGVILKTKGPSSKTKSLIEQQERERDRQFDHIRRQRGER